MAITIQVTETWYKHTGETVEFWPGLCGWKLQHPLLAELNIKLQPRRLCVFPIHKGIMSVLWARGRLPRSPPAVGHSALRKYGAKRHG